MKLLLLILLFPSLLQAQSLAVSKDSSVTVVANDPRITLFYTGKFKIDSTPTHRGGSGFQDVYEIYGRPKSKITAVVKFDTLGGWHLVSDTAKGRWNPTSAMYLYEVRQYEHFYYTKDMKTEDKYITSWINPKHIKWLDSNHKPFYLKVWAIQ